MSAPVHPCQSAVAVDCPLPLPHSSACSSFTAAEAVTSESAVGGSLSSSSPSLFLHSPSSPLENLRVSSSHDSRSTAIVLGPSPASLQPSGDHVDASTQLPPNRTTPHLSAFCPTATNPADTATIAVVASSFQSTSSSPAFSVRCLPCSPIFSTTPRASRCPFHLCCASRRRATLCGCALFVCLLLIAVGVSVGVLYPQPPSISAHSLRLLHLSVDLAPSASASGASNSTASSLPPVTVSALLSVSFTLHNRNAYSAHHYASLVNIRSLPPAAPLYGQIVIPAGFLEKNGDEEVLTSVYVSTSITAPEQIAAWESDGMRVEATAATRGYVDFLFGLQVDYTVHTLCSATLTLRMQQSTVDVSQQQCKNGL